MRTTSGRIARRGPGHRTPAISPTAHSLTLRQRASRLLPVVGAAVLVGYLVASTDIEAVGRAFAEARLLAFCAIVAVSGVGMWLADSSILAWLLTRAFHGVSGPVRLREAAPLKGATYFLNIVNYNAAALGIAWAFHRRRGVPLLQAIAGIAVMNYLDLVALAVLVVFGLLLGADLLAAQPELLVWLRVVATATLGGALVVTALVQSPIRLRLLVWLRGQSVVKPLSRLTPGQTLAGVLLRVAFVMGYVLVHYLGLWAFGAEPSLPRLLVVVPVLTVVGVVPLSVSGIGTTQVLMRLLYAPMFVDGREPGPVIDAYSTASIFGFMIVRLLIAAFFLRTVLRDMKGDDTEESP